MKVFEVACNIVVEEGVDRLFGLMGDGNMSIITYLSGPLEIPFASSRHEAGAIGMADGYARASGNVGVCTVTQGPGLTNTMTALVTARKARSPMVLFVGDVAKVQAGWPQDVDQDAFLAAAGVPVIHLTDARSAHEDVREAFRLARSSSAPVCVSCPIDAQQKEWDPWDVDLERPIEEVEETQRASVADVQAAVALLRDAKRPLIIAGRGALRAASGSQLRAFGESIGALLATTLPAKGLFEGDPFNLGIAGSLGTNFGVSLIGQADVVLAVGAGLNDFTTLKGTLFGEGVTVIRCDRFDDSSPNRYAADFLLIGDARAVAEQLLEVVTSEVRDGVGWRTPELRQALDDYDVATEFMDQSEPDAIDPRTLMTVLDDILPKDRQIVTDVGHFFGFPATYLRAGEGGRYMPAVEFGAVGMGLGVALGAAAARPELTTVLFIGDGGLMMSLPDLDTAARTKAHLVIIVMNDGAYGSELHMLRNWKMAEDAAVFENPELSAVGASLGLRTFVARTVSDLRALADRITTVEGPVLIDCRVTQKVIAGWLEGAFVH
jgi:thiamine pyrophosphate-dependent acetolactate synthase large subunit-like protein